MTAPEAHHRPHDPVGRAMPSAHIDPGELLHDEALNRCSDAAQLLWRRCIDWMHFCDPYGHLALDGAPMSDAHVAKLMGWSVSKTASALAELAAAQVSSVTPDGLVYCRSMLGPPLKGRAP